MARAALWNAGVLQLSVSLWTFHYSVTTGDFHLISVLSWIAFWSFCIRLEFSFLQTPIPNSSRNRLDNFHPPASSSHIQPPDSLGSPGSPARVIDEFCCCGFLFHLQFVPIRPALYWRSQRNWIMGWAWQSRMHTSEVSVKQGIVNPPWSTWYIFDKNFFLSTLCVTINISVCFQQQTQSISTWPTMTNLFVDFLAVLPQVWNLKGTNVVSNLCAWNRTERRHIGVYIYRYNDCIYIYIYIYL